ncbi:MAG: ATP-binding protein [Bacteroidia bacterium]|nr:ATP-binding protein [Bacteroidia bacterium]
MKQVKNDISTHPRVRVTILVGFFLALSAVAGMSYFAYDNVKDLAFSLQVAINPDTFYNELSRLEKSLNKTNESVRNYTLTRNTQTLSGYYQLNSEIFDKLDNLEDFSAGHLNQSKAVADIHDMIIDLMDINDSIIVLGDENGEVVSTFSELTQKNIEELSSKDFNEESLISMKEEKTTSSNELPTVEESESLDTSEEETEEKKRNWLFGRSKSRKKKNESKQTTPVVKPKPDTVIVYHKIQPEFPTDLIPANEVDKLRDDTEELMDEAENRQIQIQEKILALTEKGRSQMTRISVEFQKLEKAKEVEKGNLVVDAGILVEETLLQLKIFGSALILVFALLLSVIYADMNHNHRLQVGLSQEKARAEKLGKAKEEFLANMSHEIRTPMNAVIGFAEQLAETSLNKQQKEFLRPIRNSAKYLLGLINDILDYSKIESGNFRLESIGFRPENVLESVRDTFSAGATRKGINLVCEKSGELPAVLKGDPLRLKQMLFNLVSNAIKFTHDGEVRLTASTEGESEQGQILRFEIADTGVGIPQKSMDKIFMDFEQADNTTTRKYGGTGLGLSITKKLAEMMGGEITISSQEGVGTKATLVIPFTPGTEADVVETTAFELQQAGLLRGTKALIADDEPYNRLLIKTIMDKWGVNADVVENGKEVMFHLDKNPAYDFILMDLQMPEMDGFETSTRIRNERKMNLPILALTATATPSEIKTIESKGMNGYLLKPFDQGELYGRLVRLLGLEKNTPMLPKETEPEKPNIPTNGHSAYNLDQLFHLANQDSKFVVSMLTIFLSNATTNLEKLNQGAASGDWENVSMAAHKMIPPSRHLGLDNIVNHLKTIELDAQNRSNTAQIPQKVQTVSREINHIFQVIRKDIERLSIV